MVDVVGFTPDSGQPAAAPAKYDAPYWDALASKAESEAGIPKGLLLAVKNSGEKSNADQVSSAGARTPFQIIPGTRDAFLKKYGVDAYADDASAAKVAALHLKESLDRGNTPEGAVREYHGGPDRSKWGATNAAYGQRVMKGFGVGSPEVTGFTPDAAPASAGPGKVTAADYGRTVMEGGASAVRGVGKLAEAAGLESIGQGLQELGKNAEEYWRQGLSAGALESRSKKFLNDDLSIGDFNKHTVGLMLANSLLPMAAMAVPGGMAAKGLQAAGVGAGAAGAVGFGAAEGAISGAMDANQAADHVREMPEDKLVQSPFYQKAYWDLPDSMPDSVRRATAREAIVKLVSTDVGLKAGLVVGLLSAPFGAVAGRAMRGVSGAGRALAEGLAVEPLSEAAQSAGEQVAQNAAVKQFADPSQTLMEDVPNQTLGGAIAGVAMSGAPAMLSAAAHAKAADAKRLDELRAKEDGTKPVQTTDDFGNQVEIPGRPGEPLTPAETLEKEVLSGEKGKAGGGDALRPRVDAVLETLRQPGYLAAVAAQDPQAKDELLHAAAVARNPKADPLLRERALAGLEQRLADLGNVLYRPDFTMPAPQPSTAMVPSRGFGIGAARPAPDTSIPGEAVRVTETLPGPAGAALPAPTTPVGPVMVNDGTPGSTRPQTMADLEASVNTRQREREAAARAQELGLNDGAAGAVAARNARDALAVDRNPPAALPAPETPSGRPVLINDTDPELTRGEQIGDLEAQRNREQGARERAARDADLGITAGTREAIDAAAHRAATSPHNDLREPTEGQKAAGNYQKGHVRVAGLDVAIENPAGSKRRPEWPTLRSHYGYVKRTEGADGDQVDVFVRPGTAEGYDGPVFVVDQKSASGRFDEHKAMIGWPDEASARAGYLENYTPGWNGIRAVTRMSAPEFRSWLETGDTTRPAAGHRVRQELEAAKLKDEIQRAVREARALEAQGISLGTWLADADILSAEQVQEVFGDEGKASGTDSAVVRQGAGEARQPVGGATGGREAAGAGSRAGVDRNASQGREQPGNPGGAGKGPARLKPGPFALRGKWAQEMPSGMLGIIAKQSKSMVERAVAKAELDRRNPTREADRVAHEARRKLWHVIVQSGGMSEKEAADIGIDPKSIKGYRLAGFITPDGMRADILARTLAENGYLTPRQMEDGGDEAARQVVADLLAREFVGDEGQRQRYMELLAEHHAARELAATGAEALPSVDLAEVADYDDSGEWGAVESDFKTREISEAEAMRLLGFPKEEIPDGRPDTRGEESLREPAREAGQDVAGGEEGGGETRAEPTARGEGNREGDREGATAVAEKPRLYVQSPDGRRFEVDDYEDASRKWLASGDVQKRAGSMATGAVPIVDQDGKTVALMGVNGRVTAFDGSGVLYAPPEADVTPADDDAWLKELFVETAAETPVAPIEDKADLAPVRAAIAAVRASTERDLADWQGRAYKQNKNQVELRGDGPSRRESLSIGGINEARRNKAIAALQGQLAALEKIEAQIATPEGARALMRMLDETWARAVEGVKADAGSRFKTAGDLFEYLVLQDQQPARGAIDSNPLSRALRALKETPKTKTRAKLDGQKRATAQAAIDAFNADDAKTGMEIVAKLKLDALKEVGAAIGFSVNFTENATRYRERLATVADRLTKSARDQSGRERKLFDRLSSLANDWDRMADHTGAPEGSYDGKWMTHPDARKYLVAELDKLKGDPDFYKVAPMVRKARPRLFDAAEAAKPVDTRTADEKMADFRKMVAEQKANRARLEAKLARLFERDGAVKGVRKESKYGQYLLLTAGMSGTPYRVTSIDDQGPSGHRDYNSIAEAANEFAHSVTIVDGPAPRVKAPVTPQVASPGMLKTFIGIAADSIEQLRKADVERVLTSNPKIYQAAIAQHIRDKRPDLADEVDAVLADLAPAQEKGAAETAEQAIRAAVDAVTERTIGSWYPITVEFGGRAQQFLSNIKAVRSDGKTKPSVSLVQIRMGRMLSGQPAEPLFYGYRLTGKNELTEEGIPRRPSDAELARWERAFGKVGAAAEPITPDAAANMQRGDIVRDSKGVEMFHRTREDLPAMKFRTIESANGLPTFANDRVALAMPRLKDGAEPGLRRMAFDIVDVPAAKAGLRKGLSQKSAREAATVGKVLVDVNADGHFVSFRNIEVDEERRNNGHAGAVVASMLANNPKGMDMQVWDILPDARAWWDARGVKRNFSDIDMVVGKLNTDGYLTARDRHGPDRFRRDSGSPEEEVARADVRAADAGGGEGGRGGLRQAGGGADEGRVAAVRAQIAPALERWKNAPPVRVVASTDDLPIGPRIREMRAEREVRGWFDGTTAWLVAGNLKTQRDALETLFHEVVGHYGLRGLLGPQMDAVLQQVYAANERAIRDLVGKEYGHLDLTQRAHRMMAAEEFLSIAAQRAATDPMHVRVAKALKRIVGMIRDFLRSLGADLPMNDADIEALIARSRRFVESGAVHGGVARGAQASFSRLRERALGGLPMFHRQATAAAAPAFRASGPLDALFKAPMQGLGIDRLTGAAYDRLLGLLGGLVPESVKAGVVSDYMLPESVTDRRALMQAHIRRELRGVESTIERLMNLTRAESRVAYQWMTNANAGDDLLAELPDDSRALLRELKGVIDQMGQEAVRLGQLSADAFERNRMAYLHRSYLKHELGATEQDKARRARAIKILGDQYKGRGLTDNPTMAQMRNVAPEFWKRKLVAGKADTALRGEKFIRFERRANRGEGVFVLPGMEKTDQLGKLLEVQYWPAAEPVPARFGAWHREGVWEVRDTKGDKLVVWRDFTQAERERMGEIDEVKYAVARTLHQMIHDVEVGKYLEWLANTQGRPEPDGREVPASESMVRTYGPADWVLVPQSTIPGTKTRVYGKLAGLYVPGPVWNDVRQVANVRYAPLGETYAALLRAWKVSKTALSPAVHLNNIMANFVMADWHDVSGADIVRAMKVLTSPGEPSNKALLGRFEDNGGTQGQYVLSEIQREQLRPLLEQLRREVEAADPAAGVVNAVGVLQAIRAGDVKAALAAARDSKVAGAAGAAVDKLTGMYEKEDTVFRLAAFLKALEDGKNDREAGKAARQSFLDYQINAPWIAAMRATAFPFISFTYRAIPMLLETAARKPWKIAKLAAVAAVLNALGYALSGGDEDKERKVLPDEKGGRVWGAVPKLVRMPWNDAHGSPVFMDIRRFIPVGDIFDTGQNHAAIPVLPFAVPGGPLAVVAELLFNRSQFTGKDIVKGTDTAVETGAKVVDHLWKALSPNFPVLNPGSYSSKSLFDAGTGKTDPFGRELSALQAAASGFGVKIEAYPRDVAVLNLLGEKKAKDRELMENVTALRREFARKGISEEDFKAKVMAQMEKRRRVSEEFLVKVQ